MKIILKWLISASSIMISAYLIPEIFVKSFITALFLSLFLGIINITLKPILTILTLPINILTLGLFTFVINAGLILMVSAFVKGFEVSGFFAALLFGVVLSIVSYILNVIFLK